MLRYAGYNAFYRGPFQHVDVKIIFDRSLRQEIKIVPRKYTKHVEMDRGKSGYNLYIEAFFNV